MKLSEFAKECRDTWKEDRSGVPVVGLEHLEPGEVKLSIWDVDSENTFTKRFNKGQVLLGRRRVYLRKAVVAPFDGICSGDITVIEAIPGKILPELLPFVIQNDAFFDYAEQGSAGSLSPRVKWEHLKDFEVNLPSIDNQKVLAEKLWAAYRLKESYKKLLAATDEMVKSRFIEMFEGKDYECVRMEDLCSLVTKGTTPTSIGFDFTDNGINFIKAENICDDGSFDIQQCSHIDLECHEKMKRSQLKEQDILFSIAGVIGRTAIVTKAILPANTNQALAVIRVRENAAVNLRYLVQALSSKSIQSQCKTNMRGAAQMNISLQDINNFLITLPPTELQNEFERIYNQADKSGFVGSNRGLSRCLVAYQTLRQF